MSIDSSSSYSTNFNRTSDIFARFRAGASSDSQDLASLLGLGKNDSTGQNLPGTNGTTDLFKALDANGDGSLSTDEFSSLSSGFSPQTFNSLLSLQADNSTDPLAQAFVNAGDTDKSGGLSLDELTAEANKVGLSASDTASLSSLFTKLDTDKDGSLSTAEISAGTKPPSSTDLAKAFLDQADTDKSGGLSLDELTAESTKIGATADSQSLSKLFDKLDTNGDGSLDASELKKAFGHHRHHHDSMQADTSTTTDTSGVTAASATGTDNTTDTSASSTFAQQAASAYSAIASVAIPVASMMLL